MTVGQVFVLDDDPEFTKLIRRACMGIGLPAKTFNTVEPFKEVDRFPPDAIIVLDLNLGAGNGIDVLRFLAGRRCMATIYLTSGVDERLLNTAMKLGQSYGLNIRGTIPKPFRISELQETLRSAMTDPPQVNRRKPSREEELHRAIIAGELRLHYQPKIEIRTGALIGCEALVRWEHPHRGLVPPLDFLPLAEETGLIAPMTQWVLNEAIRQIAAWRRDGLDLNVAVNMPADMLSQLSLPTVIDQILALHGVLGAQLTLEVTEAAAMKDLLTGVDVLTRLRLVGISLSIDDFGTGHSSLARLRQLPFSEIKIDQMFVRDASSDREARSLIQTMVSMARGVKMKVVAEGVENGGTLAVLAELGCDAAQGYHINRPVPAEEFAGWGRAWSGSTGLRAVAGG